MSDQAFFDRLKTQRELSGLTQEQVALVLGVDRSVISKLESGYRELRVDELRKLANLYRVPAAFLLSGQGEDAELSYPERRNLPHPLLLDGQRNIEPEV